MFINNTQGSFTVIYNSVLQSKNLTLEQKGLLGYLLSLPTSKDWNLSVEGLAKVLPEGKDKIRRVLNEMIELGYLVKYQRRSDDGRLTHNDFEVFQTPQAPENTDVPPSTGFPTTVPPSQKNKYKKINNNISPSSSLSHNTSMALPTDTTTTDHSKDLNADQDLEITEKDIRSCIDEVCRDRELSISSADREKRAQEILKEARKKRIYELESYVYATLQNHIRGSSKGTKKPVNPSFKRFKQNDYDFEALEKQLLGIDQSTAAPRAAPS